MPASAATSRRKPSGFRNSRPQPSPDLPSAATAPRCVSLASEEMAVATSQWLGLSSSWAIRPKPQLSCSNSGLYNVPCRRLCLSISLPVYTL
ncbi:Uncharacterised protein [Chromobacterium violaceum]|uniref:Uncharacterized protein n=1 Tax=Chromobacterium violaceum TaxID=536 RepID=A0A447TKD1_CHRVL|nr:Uncharacterised protein [Chromobacterium violaceum]